MAYDYSRVRTAGQQRYHQAIVDIVDDVDGITDAATKHVALLLKKLTKFDALVKSDKVLQRLDENGNRAYGWKQQLAYMRKALDKVEEASKELGHTYDEFNSWTSKWLPKDEEEFTR